MKVQKHMDITRDIIGAAIDVHKALGPGLLESAYQACLVYELMGRGRQVEQQVPQPCDAAPSGVA